jgi:hypothetical protein
VSAISEHVVGEIAFALYGIALVIGFALVGLM